IGRPQPAEALKMQGRFGRNERQRHKFSEASGAALKIADVQQMPRPVPVVIDMAEHDSGGGLEAKGVGRFDDFEPLGGRDLVWTDDGADFIVEDFRRGAGQRAKAGFFQLRQKRFDWNAEGGRALPYFQGRECMQVDSRADLFDRAANRQICRAVVGGMNAALKADLHGASVPGLLRTTLNFVQTKIVGSTA